MFASRVHTAAAATVRRPQDDPFGLPGLTAKKA
jgi:hypothetical protein